MIYALECANSHYYVGHTDGKRGGHRIVDHFNKNGSAWTKLHRPLNALLYEEGTLEDENRMTLHFMAEYGWWRVRGGKWCAIKMPRCPDEFLKSHYGVEPKRLGKVPGLCSRCGRPYHFAYQCRYDTMPNGDTIKDDFCLRCMKPGHESSECIGSGKGTLKRFYSFDVDYSWSGVAEVHEMNADTFEETFEEELELEDLLNNLTICDTCGEVDHEANVCLSQDTIHQLCDNGGHLGHESIECFKLLQMPEEFLRLTIYDQECLHLTT